MRSIPKGMLIHAVTLSAVTTEDKWGNTGFSEPVTLTNVRFEPLHSLITTKDNRQLQLNAVLFYDCNNSFPKKQSFALENAIVFNGRTYTIKSIEPLYDGKKLHHYEMGLM